MPKLLLVCLFLFLSSPWGRYLIPFCKHYLWTQNARNMSLHIVCTTCPEPSYWHLLMSDPSAELSLSFCCKPDLLMQGCFHVTTTIVTNKLHLPSSVPIVRDSWLFLLRTNVKCFWKKERPWLVFCSSLLLSHSFLDCTAWVDYSRSFHQQQTLEVQKISDEILRILTEIWWGKNILWWGKILSGFTEAGIPFTYP